MGKDYLVALGDQNKIEFFEILDKKAESFIICKTITGLNILSIIHSMTI